MAGKFLTRSVVIGCSIAVSVAGCATASKDIASAYVSPNQYAHYDCRSLGQEAARIQQRVLQLGGRLDQAAANDAGLMAIGLLLFWPTLFFIGGTKQQEAEYARLKGEYDAVEQAAIVKRCFQPANPPQIASAPTAQPSAQPPAQTFEAMVPRSANYPENQVGLPEGAPIRYQAPIERQPPAAATRPAVITEMKYQLTAEKLAKGNDCVDPAAALNAKAPGTEVYSITCASGHVIVVRCDYNDCRLLTGITP